MVDGHAWESKSEETRKASFSEQIWQRDTGWEVLCSATKSTYNFSGSDFFKKDNFASNEYETNYGNKLDPLTHIFRHSNFLLLCRTTWLSKKKVCSITLHGRSRLKQRHHPKSWCHIKKGVVVSRGGGQEENHRLCTMAVQNGCQWELTPRNPGVLMHRSSTFYC